MPVCVAAVPNASGAYVLALDPGKTDISQCTYFIEDGASNAWRELGNMSLADAGVISTAVGVVWAIAFGFKMVIRAMRSDEATQVS